MQTDESTNTMHIPSTIISTSTIPTTTIPSATLSSIKDSAGN